MITKQVTIEAHPQSISAEVVSFMEKNMKSHPGKSTFKFTLTEPTNKMKISLVTMTNGFEMNEENGRIFREKTGIGSTGANHIMADISAKRLANLTSFTQIHVTTSC